MLRFFQKLTPKVMFFWVSFMGWFSLHAQLTTAFDTPVNLVTNVLVGNGVNVSNISSQGAPIQFGTFNGANSNIGINSGVVIATCNINPPNGLSAGQFPVGAGTPGDPSLGALIGGAATFNAGILQFDFIPTGDTLKFDYVFASNEYNFYVNSNFNDVFAFFLTGPNPQGGVYTNYNIALIPGTNLPVTINNVNNGQSGGCAFGPCNNCQYFIDNCNPTSVTFGGFTTVLTAIAPVVPCVPYTIRLGVADVLDGALNSAVFLKAGSFSSGLVSLSSEIDYGSTDTLLYEGCSNATIRFTRSGDNSSSDTVNYTISGTATNGVDYNFLPGIIVFPPGVDTVMVVISPLFDGLAEPTETIIITVMDTICGQPFVSQVQLQLLDVSPLTLITNDTAICLGQIFNLAFGYTGGSGNFTINWTFNGNTIPPPYLQMPPNNRTYIVSVYDDCLDTTITQPLNVLVYPKPTIDVPNYTVCSGEDLLIVPNPTNLNGFGYTWSPSTYINDSSLISPTFNTINNSNNPLPYIVVLAVDSGGVVCSRDSATILVYPLPKVGLNGDTTILCEDLTVVLNGTPGFVAYSWTNGPSTQNYTISQPGWYYLTVTDNFNCQNTDSIFALKQFRPVFSLPDVQICRGDTAFLSAPDSLGTVTWSNGQSGPNIQITENTELVVTIQNFCGSTSDTLRVEVIEGIPPFVLPNVVVPNSTIGNDKYGIAALENAETFQWDIYNRWGIKIFTTTTMGQMWDGKTPEGQLVAQGTYFIVVNYIDCLGNEGRKAGTVNVFY